MSSATLAFDILTRYKDKGADKAARDMDKVSKSSHRMTGSLKKAAVAAGLGFSFIGVARGLASMTKNAIEDDAAQRKLAVGLRNATNATHGQIGAVEKWIARQGVALGVTDDELRPAFQRLVQATGSISKAQRLAGVAMDASAGSGKSLKTVTEAIAKAQNGNLGSLSRLGIKIKSARGETLTFDQAMRGMAKTFKGQAEARAGTLQGKMDRLRLIIDETKEAVGARLIPVVTKFADWVLRKGMPAAKGFASDMKSGEGAAGALGTALKIVGGILMGTAKFLNEHRSVIVAVVAAYVAWKVTALSLAAANKVSLFWLKAHTVGTVQQTVVSKSAMIATKVWTAATWALGAATKFALGPWGLAIIAVGLLTGAIVLAYKKSETFRAIVQGAWKIIGTVARTYWNFYLKPVLTAFATAFKVAWNAAKAAKDGIGKAWQGIRSAAQTSTRWVVDKVLWMSEKVLDGAVAAFGWAPKVGDQLKKAREKVRSFRDQVNKDLGGINDEGVNVTVKGFWRAPKNVAMSKLLGHFRRGGPIRGPGGGTDDRVPILASNNEHMLTASDVKKAGGHAGVFAIRRMLQRGTWPKYGDVPKYAEGGPVFGLDTRRPNLAGARAMAATGARVWAAMLQAKLREVWKALGGAGALTPSQISRGQRFARSQVGDPYVWGGVGPNGFDCSGFVGAVLNAAQGRNPYTRRGTTSTMPWPGFSAGPGSFSVGWFRGAPGHMAGSIGGMGIESAGGVGVRVGGAARRVASFPNVAHYDRGGMLQPGWTLAYNGTGRAERVVRGGDDVITIRLVLEYPDGRKVWQDLKKVRRDVRHPLGLE